jgi:PAS domain-containing protein
LDSLPFGAIAVSRQGEIIFINQTIGRLLGINNPRSLQNMSLQNPKLGLLGDRLALSLKDKMPLVREYLDIAWAGQPRRFRLDSSEGVVPGAGAWGTLFLIQESFKSIQDEPPTI